MKTELASQNSTFWTAAREQELRKLWERGLAVDTISRKMHTTNNSIIGKASRLKLKRRHQTKKPPAEKTNTRLTGQSEKTKSKSPWRMQRKREAQAGSPVETTAGRWYVPEEHVPLPGSTPRSLLDLGNNECRWPFGHSPDLMFCGEKTHPGKSYCPTHHTASVQTRQSKLDLRVVDIPEENSDED